MGIYVNPGNQAFAEIADSNYVDKTGMIRLINERIGGPEKLICISRPRRLGKTSPCFQTICENHRNNRNKRTAFLPQSYNRKVYEIGVAFDSELRKLVEWKAVQSV